MCKTSRFSRRVGAAAAFLFSLAGMGATQAASAPLTVLHSFTGTDGSQPANGLVAGADGFLYGDTDAVRNTGNTALTDSVYRVRRDGSEFQSLHTFAGVSTGGTNAEGSAPNRLLLLNGFLYGTSLVGGPAGTGVVFKMDTRGGLQILHTFSALSSQNINADGANPAAGLTAGPDGSLYGTAQTGGTAAGGVVYKINADGSGFAVLHTFTPGSGTGSAGSQPNTALAAAGDGLLYGTSQSGGVNNRGTIYRLAPGGQSFAKVHDFTTQDGISAFDLLSASDGKLYGTAFAGGSGQGGTLFQISTAGAFQVLHSFVASSGQVAIPLTPPVESPDGTLYGATNGGGAEGSGIVYQVNKDGTNFQEATSFTSAAGVSPNGTLLIANGRLFSTALAGGASSNGSLLALSLPFAPSPHILWGNTNGMVSLWTVTTDFKFTFHNYGPYSGWTARAVADTPDGYTHILWNHSPDGQVAIWDVDAAGVFTHSEYGPYSGWTATSLSAGPDGKLHLLWNHSPDNQMALWTVSSPGNFTHIEYGPYSGWTAKGVATGGDGVTDVFWTRAEGTVSSWKISPTNGSFVHYEYGPYSGWTANALAVGPDSRASLLWSNTNGTQSLWNADFGTGLFSHSEYGPYSGWAARSVAVGSDRVRRLLWSHAPDSQASLWRLGAGSEFTYANYGPYSGWTALSLSVSQ